MLWGLVCRTHTFLSARPLANRGKAILITFEGKTTSNTCVSCAKSSRLRYITQDLWRATGVRGFGYKAAQKQRKDAENVDILVTPGSNVSWNQHAGAPEVTTLRSVTTVRSAAYADDRRGRNLLLQKTRFVRPPKTCEKTCDK